MSPHVVYSQHSGIHTVKIDHLSLKRKHSLVVPTTTFKALTNTPMALVALRFKVRQHTVATPICRYVTAGERIFWSKQNHSEPYGPAEAVATRGSKLLLQLASQSKHVLTRNIYVPDSGDSHTVCAAVGAHCHCVCFYGRNAHLLIKHWCGFLLRRRTIYQDNTATLRLKACAVWLSWVLQRELHISRNYCDHIAGVGRAQSIQSGSGWGAPALERVCAVNNTRLMLVLIFEIRPCIPSINVVLIYFGMLRPDWR